MNNWQLCQQIRKIVRDRTWPGTTNVVFHQDSVEVVAQGDALAEFLMRRTFPMLAITPQSGQNDPRFEADTGIMRQEYQLTSGVLTPGPKDSRAMLRFNPPEENRSRSLGQGLLAIEEELLAVVKILEFSDGVDILWRGVGPTAAVHREDGWLIARSYRFATWITEGRTYPTVDSLRGADNGGGDALLKWANPGDRYDRVKLVIRRASGSTPPATVTDGTGITVVGFPTTLVDSPGVGTWSYSFFVWYDDVTADANQEKTVSSAKSIAGLVLA